MGNSSLVTRKTYAPSRAEDSRLGLGQPLSPAFQTPRPERCGASFASMAGDPQSQGRYPEEGGVSPDESPGSP